jgi:hypothetical protein
VIVSKIVAFSKENYHFGLGLRVLVVSAIIFLGLQVGFLKGMLIEEIQQILFFVLFFFIYIYSRNINPKVPRSFFLIVLILWLGLYFRIFIMRELGYFKGRIVVGRFDKDEHGYEARNLLLELKRIGQTYNLPGPVALPISVRDLEKNVSKYNKWMETSVRPSLFIFGHNDDYELIFPSPRDVSPQSNMNFPVPDGALLLSFNGYSESLMIPGIPHSVRIPKTPEPVMHHYVSWLSAFFHPEIALDPIARIDVINEAARIRGPWRNEIPKILARYLFTYQEFLMWYPSFTDYELDLLLGRLSRAMFGLQQSPHPELYAHVVTLKALCLFAKTGDERARLEGLAILESLIKNTSVPMKYKLVAAYNLAVVEGVS